jgi:hypothetical protein
VSLPTAEFWGGSGEYNVYVYLVPSTDRLIRDSPYGGSHGFGFEEVGEDNFSTPHGVRQWYESAPSPSPDTPDGQLAACLYWADGHASELRPIKWHPDGWACAVFRVREGARAEKDLGVQVTIGALLLADTHVQPSVSNRRLKDFESFHYYSSGGIRLISSDLLASRIFASYSRQDRWVVEAVESVLALLDSVQFVWDLRVLKAGELWNERILAEIERADAFQ